MSKPSIRTGTRSRASASCREESVSTRCWRRCSRRSLSWASASLAFFSASSRSRRRSPRDADPDLDLRVALAGERLGEHAGAALQLGPDDHPAGDRRRGAVVLEQEGLGDLPRVAVLTHRLVLARQVEALSLRQHAVAHLEDLCVRVASLDRHGDQVRAAQRAAGHLLALHHRAHRVEPVAEERRPLEVLGLGGLLHLRLEVARDLLVAAGEEGDDPVDVSPVLLLVDVAHAGRLAAIDVVVETGDPRAPAGLRSLAGPVLEELAEQVEGLANALGAGEGAEVGAIGPVALASEVDARKLLVEADADVRIGLVVPQPDVEPGAVALDEALLRKQRLGLVPGDQELDRVRPVDQLGRAAHARSAAPALAREVRRDPLADRVRLADVEGLTRPVAENVDAGSVGELLALFGQLLAALSHLLEGRVLTPAPRRL